MKQYLDLVREIRDQGVKKSDRTGTGIFELFGPQLRFDLSKGFPLVTTKKVFFKGIVHELLWMLSGSTNIKYLNDNGVHIWDQWADEKGELGPVYGSQWRKWTFHKGDHPREMWKKSIDQIANLIEEIKTKPNSRRMIVTAWNPAEVDKMALPPCHLMMQFNVEPARVDESTPLSNWSMCAGTLPVIPGKLNCHLYQRSADMFLGVPFNIASYALLTSMIAQVCDLQPGTLICSYGSAHLYLNHMQQVAQQLRCNPFPSPQIKLNPEIKDIDDFKYEDVELVDYLHHPQIKAPISV